MNMSESYAIKVMVGILLAFAVMGLGLWRLTKKYRSPEEIAIEFLKEFFVVVAIMGIVYVCLRLLNL